MQVVYDLETFLATLAICGFQDKFSSIITSRKTDSLTRSIEWLLNVNVIDISYVFLICLSLKIMKFEVNRKPISLKPLC